MAGLALVGNWGRLEAACRLEAGVTVRLVLATAEFAKPRYGLPSANNGRILKSGITRI